jgi:hypothetical protein
MANGDTDSNAYVDDYTRQMQRAQQQGFWNAQKGTDPAPGTETSPTDPTASAPVKKVIPSPEAPPSESDWKRLYPVHEPANLQPMPQPADYGLDPRQQVASGFGVFKNPLIWVGILGSLLTRRPALAAMTFAGGAMKGYDEGNTEVFNKNKEKFDEAVKQTEAQNRIELEHYKEIWESNQERTWQGSLPKLYEEASKNGDQTMMQLLSMGAPMEQIEKYLIQKGEKANALSEQLALYAAKQNIPKPSDPKWLESPPGQEWIKQQPPEQQQQYNKFVQEHTALTALKPGEIPPQMTQEQFDIAADYWRKTGKHMQLGFGPQMNAIKLQVENHALQRQKDNIPIDPAADKLAATQAGYAGQVSGARSFGTRRVNIEMAGNAAAYAIPQALEASDAFPRGKWQPINAAKLRLAEAGSNVQLSDWDVKNLGIAELYARALNPQGQTIRQDMFERSLSVLQQAKDPKAYETTLRAIYEVIGREKRALGTTGQEISGGEEVALPDPFAGRTDPRKKTPTENDRKWGQKPEYRDRFIQKFGVEP